MSHASIGNRAAGDGAFVGKWAGMAILTACGATGLCWLAWIYGHGLRDSRYFDGWSLVAIMGVQLYFHVSRKSGRLSPRSAARWRSVHICLGYILIAVFLSHSDYSLPDTAFEWMLWAGFVLVTISGVFGTYLSWSLRSRRLIDEDVGYDRIPVRRAEIARDVRTLVLESDPRSSEMTLPPSPADDWIKDLYAEHLRAFFEAQQNMVAHVSGSRRPLKRLTDEVDNLSRYVDRQGQEKLAVIRNHIIEKDRLDFARAQLGLTRVWLFVHVPVTYTLIVLTVVHVVVVYAFSSGLR